MMVLHATPFFWCSYIRSPSTHEKSSSCNYPLHFHSVVASKFLNYIYMKLTSSYRSNTAADEYQITESRTDSLMSLKQGLARAVHYEEH